ncbi:hypothetical protein OAS45_03175 [Polaribacter sp.]|nr:hypothetical protein [Polaribacter sp.]MDC1375013.1 hypothetical protein [Polaribacter sp.]
MNTMWKFFQYGYLVLAVICLVEGLFALGSESGKALILIGFSVFITFVFLLKRRFRKKIEQRNNPNN